MDYTHAQGLKDIGRQTVAAINAGHLTTGDGQSHHVYKGCVIRTPCHGCAAAADATDDGDDDDADAAAAQVAAAAAVDSQLLSASRADALTLPRTAPVFWCCKAVTFAYFAVYGCTDTKPTCGSGVTADLDDPSVLTDVNV